MRGGVSFEGIGAKYATYKLKTADNFTQDDEGKAVTVTGNGEVGYGNAGDVFLGTLLRVEADGIGSVQYAGYCEVGYPSGQQPALGAAVVVNGNGLVSQAPADFAGKGNTVVSVDTTNQKVVVLLG